MYSANTISRMFESTSSANQPVVTGKMLAKTYIWFAKRHPQEILDLLDKQFLMNDGNTIINDYVSGTLSRRNAAVTLADARESQLDPSVNSPTRKQRKADMVMAADSFLGLLRTELG